MEKYLHDLKVGLEEARRAKELYQLLSSYNAYNILLVKAESEYKGEYTSINEVFLDCDCYKNSIDDLFSLFKCDECIKANQVSKLNAKDFLFLLDQDTLLRLNSFDNTASGNLGLSYIDYEILKINNCRLKAFTKSMYFDRHFEDKDVFGLFESESLITPNYILDSNMIIYDDMDIRDILIPQSFDQIYEKLTESKNEKRLGLTRC